MTFRTACVAILFATSSLGCSRHAAVVTPGAAPPSATGERTVRPRRPADPGGIAGEYYMGDHLGSNWRLFLLRGGNYFVSLHGCEGPEGTSLGRWRTEGDRVVLEPVEEDPGPWTHVPKRRAPRALHVVAVPGDDRHRPYTVLVREDGVETFTREGPQDKTCFRPRRIIEIEAAYEAMKDAEPGAATQPQPILKPSQDQEPR